MATLHKTKWWSSLINDLWSIIQLCKYVKWIPWPLKHMFRYKSDLSRWNGFKVTAFQNFHYFERRPFWKVGKKHVSHARIPWGFFLVDTGTIRDSKPLESVCLQFCLGSPYIWAILTRLLVKHPREEHSSKQISGNPHVTSNGFVGNGSLYCNGEMRRRDIR